MSARKTSRKRKKRNIVTHNLFTAALNFPSGPVSFFDITSQLGSRSFGLGILIFSVPMVLPMPPGIPMAAGLVIMTFAFQLISGRQHLWLPNWLNQKTIDRNRLISAYSLVERYLGWMFRLARPRLPQLTGQIARRLAGLIFAILGFLMILPIPIIGNVIPAFACTVLALGLTDRDGLIYILGIGLSGLAIFSTLWVGISTFNFLEILFFNR